MTHRFLFSIALLALFAAPAAALDLRPATIVTHAGISEARMTGDFWPNTNAQRLAISVEGSYPVIPGVSFEIGAGFVGRGGDLGPMAIYLWNDTYQVYDYVGDFPVRYDADYLQFPVLLQLTSPRGAFRPLVVAGPVASIKTGQRWWVNDKHWTHEGFAQDTFRRFDWGLMGGAGLEADTRLGTWSVEGRYTQGMMDIMRPGSAGGAVKNRDLQLTIGLRRNWRDAN